MNTHHRFYILTRHKMGISGKQIFAELLLTNKDTCPSLHTIWHWIAGIKKGCFELSKVPRETCFDFCRAQHPKKRLDWRKLPFVVHRALLSYHRNTQVNCSWNSEKPSWPLKCLSSLGSSQALWQQSSSKSFGLQQSSSWTGGGSPWSASHPTVLT